jgi:hypothetical protein
MRARRDVDQLAHLTREHAMPDASGHDHCLPGAQLDDGIGSVSFEDDCRVARDEEENLVGVRVHLAAVRRRCRHARDADHEAVDTRWRPRFPWHHRRCAVASAQAEQGARKIEGFNHGYSVRLFPVAVNKREMPPLRPTVIAQYEVSDHASRRWMGVALGLLLSVPWIGGCRGCGPGSCADVPASADGCRERCHDRGAEMAFFRYQPGTYRCDAMCLCTDGQGE